MLRRRAGSDGQTCAHGPPALVERAGVPEEHVGGVRGEEKAAELEAELCQIRVRGELAATARVGGELLQQLVEAGVGGCDRVPDGTRRVSKSAAAAAKKQPPGKTSRSRCEK